MIRSPLNGQQETTSSNQVAINPNVSGNKNFTASRDLYYAKLMHLEQEQLVGSHFHVNQMNIHPALISMGEAFVAPRNQNSGQHSLSREELQEELLSNKPEDVSHFVGRQTEIESIAVNLKKHAVAVVSGPGGIGKSQLAAHYVSTVSEEAQKSTDELEKNYDMIIWLQGKKDLVEELRRISELMGIELSSKSKSQLVKEFLKDGLCRYQRVLLVIDDLGTCESFQELSKAIKSRKRIKKNWICDCLITSRNLTWHNITPIILLSLSLDQSVQLICEGLKESPSFKKLDEIQQKSQAQNLALKVHNFPLALGQAIAYIRRLKVSVSEYLRDYDANRQKLRAANKLPKDEYEAAVATTWQKSLNELKLKNSLIIHALEFVTYLDVDRVPHQLMEVWLHDAQSQRFIFGVHEQVMATDFKLDILEPWLQYSLVYPLEDGGSFRMHRLLQEVIKDRVPKDEVPDDNMQKLNEITETLYLNSLVNILNSYFCYFHTMPRKHLPQSRELLPQVSECIKSILPAIDKVEDKRLVCDLVLKLCAYYYYEVPFTHRELAISHLKELLKYFESDQYVSSKHEFQQQDFSAIHFSLGNALFGAACEGKLTRLDEALKYYFSSLKKGNYPDIHPNLAKIYHQVGNVFSRAGKYDKAKEYYNKALHINLFLQKNDSDTTKDVNLGVANNQHELANILSVQGNHTKAITTIKSAVELKRNFYGNTLHPDLACTLDMLGLIYMRMGNREKAKDTLKEALSIYKQTYSSIKHVECQVVLNHLKELGEEVNDKNHSEIVNQQTCQSSPDTDSFQYSYQNITSWRMSEALIGSSRCSKHEFLAYVVLAEPRYSALQRMSYSLVKNYAIPPPLLLHERETDEDAISSALRTETTIF